MKGEMSGSPEAETAARKKMSEPPALKDIRH